MPNTPYNTLKHTLFCLLLRNAVSHAPAQRRRAREKERERDEIPWHWGSDKAVCAVWHGLQGYFEVCCYLFMKMLVQVAPMTCKCLFASCQLPRGSPDNFIQPHALYLQHLIRAKEDLNTTRLFSNYFLWRNYDTVLSLFTRSHFIFTVTLDHKTILKNKSLGYICSNIQNTLYGSKLLI